MTHFICNVMLMAEIHIQMTTRFTATTFVCDSRSPKLCIRHMRGTACFALRRRLCVGDRSHDSWVAMTREKERVTQALRFCLPCTASLIGWSPTTRQCFGRAEMARPNHERARGYVHSVLRAGSAHHCSAAPVGKRASRISMYLDESRR